ncbi:hypothetical protein V8E36_009210 [Tilletia maclaganii]
MGINGDLSFDVHGIVSAWPLSQVPRERLVLWRNLVLVIILRCRSSAGATARHTGKSPNLRHCDETDVLAAVASAIFSTLTASFDRVKTSNHAEDITA